MLDEWNSDAFKRLHLTSETLTWDPTTTLYEEQEAAMVDHPTDHATHTPAVTLQPKIWLTWFNMQNELPTYEQSLLHL
jgi:hypothetical protein